MSKGEYVWRSLIHSAGVVLYVTAVGLLMFNARSMFGGPDNFLMPVFMMLLIVISASVTGLLVLGKPITLYLSGQKKDAFTLLLATLGWLIVFAMLTVSILVLQKA